MCTLVCNVCKEKVDSEIHLCYIHKEEFKKPSDKLLFLDFETYNSDSGELVPICCYAIWYDAKK